MRTNESWYNAREGLLTIQKKNDREVALKIGFAHFYYIQYMHYYS